jgi:hypothetical protein
MPLPRLSLRLATALALSLLCLACAKEREGDFVSAASVTVPADEATPEERERINATLDEIEALAGQLARPQSFRSLPVIVTTESMAESHRAGACYFENGRGKFILVNRVVLRQEERLRTVGLESTLFRVLLHEIGHCYFGREHLEEKISQKGRRLRFAPDRQERRPVFEEFNVSSMESKTLLIPLALKKYYVAEILGLFRARSLEDLAAYTGAVAE